MVEEPRDNPYVRDPDLDFRPIGELTREEAREQVETLRAAIRYHDRRYYVENDPVISDRAYDALFDRLEALEEAFDLGDGNSPTRRVGGEPLEELETREHVSEMLSLDSSTEESAVREFDRRVRDAVGEVDYSVEPKLDGFSVEVVYEGGEFDRAVTRGDGVRGEDVSENVRTIRSVPLSLRDAPDELAVRGEVYMPRSGFHELNEERLEAGEEPFANPRNAAAGTVRLLDPGTVAERPLDVYFYDVMACSRGIGSQSAAFDLLAELGFRVNEHNRIVGDVDAFVGYREELLEKRDDLEYEIDGVVAKVDDYAAREDLGSTARHPRWAFAYKFPAKTGETVVERIVVQVGRTGKLTPVALLDPVDVRGVTISRATLHNEARARELGVGEGATVTVERAGDVIPEVASVADPADEPFEMPEACPACGGDVVREGEHHFCAAGTSCPAQLKRALVHFCSRGAMDVEGVGERVADRLVDAGLVESLPDLYDLSEDDLADLEGFGERSARNLLEEIEGSRDPDLASFVYALGIRHVGRERARRLASAFALDELMEADVEALRSVEDVGPEAAESVRSFFDDGANREVVRRLREAGVEPTREGTGGELDGTRIAITGRIEGYTRGELVDLLERHGARVTSSVSGRTDYLVVGDDPGETKLGDAEEHGVARLEEDEFRDRVLDRIG